MIDDTPEIRTELTPEELRRRRIRSIAIGWGLAALAAMFFLITIVKLGGSVANRAL
jgi:hypothetical protein